MTMTNLCSRSVQALAALGALLLGGCGALKYGDFPAAKPRDPIPNPLPALDDITVARVATPEEFGDRAWTELLEAALLAVDGIDRVHRIERPATNGGGESKRDMPALDPSSRGLLAVRVLSFDPYYPPVAHVEVDFFMARGAYEEDRSVVELERLGSAPHRATQTERTPWIRFQKVFSVADPGVAERLRRFARSQGDEKRGTTPVDRMVLISDRFMDFVMHETVRECFARIETKEVESNGFLGQLFARSAQE